MNAKLKVVLVYAFVLLLFLGYYSWQLGRVGTPPFHNLIDENGGSYGDLAYSFVRGHLYLFGPPDPPLALSLNPYLPSERLPDTGFPWDDSYYRAPGDIPQGRFYLYFGAVPALLFYCPVLLLTGGYMPAEPMVFLAISCLDLLVFACLMRILVARYFAKVPPHLEGLLLVTYGLCNIMPYNQGRPFIYEAAIGTATTLTLCTLLFLLLAVAATSRRYLWMTLASLSAGLAFGSRPTDMFVYTLLGLIWLYLCRQKNG